MAIGTLVVEASYEPAGAALQPPWRFVAFSLFNIVIGLSVRVAKPKACFDRDILGDRRQLGLFGLLCCLSFCRPS